MYLYKQIYRKQIPAVFKSPIGECDIKEELCDTSFSGDKTVIEVEEKAEKSVVQDVRQEKLIASEGR